MARQQRMIGDQPRLRRGIGKALALHDCRRRMHVIEQRGVGGEAFFAHQLLGIEAAVGPAETDVPLSGNFPSNPVIRHIVSSSAVIARLRGRLPVARPDFFRAADCGSRLLAALTWHGGRSPPDYRPLRTSGHCEEGRPFPDERNRCSAQLEFSRRAGSPAAAVVSSRGARPPPLAAGVAASRARLYPLIFDAMLVVAAAAVLSLREAGLALRCCAWLVLLVLIAAGAGARPRPAPRD